VFLVIIVSLYFLCIRVYSTFTGYNPLITNTMTNQPVNLFVIVRLTTS